ncbi:hypothetical protein B5X24_HaOG212576 [Helicoverpa armigera]|uniref:Secreted protein n=1 Tax=Helicoverpa armigera TaxID=29058 RepID=A0A2W1B906_HELAM|nr:hypothetical protein B5X24_HaOG212576 [Helicoverpa armigera]
MKLYLHVNAALLLILLGRYHCHPKNTEIIHEKYSHMNLFGHPVNIMKAGIKRNTPRLLDFSFRKTTMLMAEEIGILK